MSETPEGKVKRKVKELLVTHGAYWFCPVQTGLGARTLDFLGTHCGRFFAIETKAPGKRMTEQQRAIADRIEKAGGKVFEINGDYTELEEWLRDQPQLCVFS